MIISNAYNANAILWHWIHATSDFCTWRVFLYVRKLFPNCVRSVSADWLPSLLRSHQAQNCMEYVYMEMRLHYWEELIRLKEIVLLHWIYNKNSYWSSRLLQRASDIDVISINTFMIVWVFSCVFAFGVGHTLSCYHIWEPIDIVMLDRLGTEWEEWRRRRSNDEH